MKRFVHIVWFTFCALTYDALVGAQVVPYRVFDTSANNLKNAGVTRVDFLWGTDSIFRMAVRSDTAIMHSMQTALAGKMSWNDTLAPSASIMTASRAADSIGALKTMVGTKLTASDTTGRWYSTTNPLHYISADDTGGWYAMYKGNTGATGPQGIQGPQGNPGSDATVTANAIKNALGYTPADSAITETAAHATATYQPVGSYATTSQLANKLNITDTTGKWVPALRTLTINGTPYGLSTNQTITVGDILSGSTYSNPSWITTLAAGKITGAPWLTAEVDGSVTNEIEIPTQSGQSGKYLTTNGSAVSWAATPAQSYTVKLWDKTSQITTAGVVVTDTFSVSSATPSITLPLPTGTTAAKVVAATGFRAGATVSNSPQVAYSAVSTTSVSLVISQQNTATVSILGINVLSGLPTILVPDPTNIKVVLSYIAY